MISNISTEPVATTREAAAPQATRRDLLVLVDSLAAADRLIARAVLAAGRLAGSGVCERVEGLDLEHYVGLACRMTSSDRRTVVAAGELLAAMPATARLFVDGQVSWSVVRQLTWRLRRVNAAVRAVIDGRIAATAADRDQPLDAYAADDLVDAAAAAIDELTDPHIRERREQAAVRSNHLQMQQTTDGRTEGFFSLDGLTGAVVANALQTAADSPTATPPHEQPGGGQTKRGKQLADALYELAAEYLSGLNSGLARTGAGAAAAGEAGRDDMQPNEAGDIRRSRTRHRDPRRTRRRRRPRPLVQVLVDVANVEVLPDGTVVLNLPGAMPRVSAATMEVLMRDSDIQAVLFDGARPLAVSRKLRAEGLPDDIRTAIVARDKACRFPGSRAPAGWGHVHHLRHREHGGDNDTANLGLFATRMHQTNIHKRGWRLMLHPATGLMTAKRRHRTWKSLPRGTPLARQPDNDSGPHADDDHTPPGMPF